MRTAVLMIVCMLELAALPAPAAGQTVIFSDGFEGAFPGTWVVGNNNGNTVAKWGDNSAMAYSGSWSAFCADNGNNARTTYDNNLNTYMQRQNISLSGYTKATFTFRYWIKTEASYDGFEVNVKNQAGYWKNHLTLSGDQSGSGWQNRTIILDEYAGQTNLTIGFDFVSDGSIVPSGVAGVFIDDVKLTGAVDYPAPDLVSVSGVPSSVGVGQAFTVSVVAEDDGGQAPEGNIHVVARYSDNSDNLVMDAASATWADPLLVQAPGTRTIYHRYGGTLTNGDWFTEGVDTPWPGGTQHTLSVRVTPQKVGTLKVLVRTTMQRTAGSSTDWLNDISANTGNPQENDEQGWECRVYTVNVVPQGEIVAFIPPPTGVQQRETPMQATVEVRNNTASERTFWVGLSFAHETATRTSWPVGYYDIQPLKTEIIPPGGTKAVTFSFAPHRNLQPGNNFARARTWDRFNEDLYLMEDPLDDTNDYPRWQDPANPQDGTGMPSFTLGSFEAAANSLLDQIEYAVLHDFFKVATLGDLYRRSPNAQKPLLIVRVGTNVGSLFGVPISVGGSVLVDLADLMGLSPEGDTWVTVWLDANAALGIDSLLLIPVDLGIVPHDFDFAERGRADQRRFSIEAGALAIPGFAFTALSCDQTGCDLFRLQWNGSTSVSLTLIGGSATLISREVNKEAIRNILLSNPTTITNLNSLCDYIINSFKAYTGLTRASTLDDGDWELIDYQREVPLQLSKEWNISEKPANYFFVDVPENRSEINVQVSGGTGNADLYMKRASRPNGIEIGDYDFKSANSGNLESIVVQSPEPGRWFIMLPTSSSYQDVELLVRMTPSSAVAISFFSATEISGTVRLSAEFSSNLGAEAVKVYRGMTDDQLTIIERINDVHSDHFEYMDRKVAPGETYHYQIGVIDDNGEFLSPVVAVPIKRYQRELAQNHPNPFNPSTEIRFLLPERERVTLAIYEATGRLVRVLVDEMRDYGWHEVAWDGRDDAGNNVNSGVYFYRLRAGKYAESKKMILLK